MSHIDVRVIVKSVKVLHENAPLLPTVTFEDLVTTPSAPCMNVWLPLQPTVILLPDHTNTYDIIIIMQCMNLLSSPVCASTVHV